MNILFTICGRSGSKGLKNKNIKVLKNFPLLYYTIAAAKLFKEKNNIKDNIDIAINSDSNEILNISKNFKDCYQVVRPLELANDISPKLPAIIYSLKYMEKIKNLKYDYVIDLDITSPLRKVSDIKNAIDSIINNNLEVVFSVVPSRRNPYFNMIEEKEGKFTLSKEANYVRRQDAPKVYDMNASIYCYKRDSLILNPQTGPLKYNFGIIEMQETGIIDIDSEKDFILLELLSDYYFNGEYKEIYEYLKNYRGE